MFPTVGAQLAGTAVALAVLLISAELVRRAGDPAKERFGDAFVESVQAGTMAVLTVLAGVFFVVLWRGTAVLGYVFDVLDFGRAEVVSTVFTLVILVGAYSATRVTKQAVRRVARGRGRITRHQRQIVHHVLQVSIFGVASLVVLALWGQNVGGLLVGAGFAGIILGFAARQTLGAVLAGFVVLFSRPFELGDWVRIDEQEGIVTDINIVNTQLRTFDDELVMVPNDMVTSEEIVNRSRKGRLRGNVDVGVDYEADLEAATALAEEAMADLDVLLEQPNPQVVLSEFGDSAVVLRLRFHIDNPSARKMWKARTDVIAAVKSAFDEADVSIPYPQRELSARDEASRVDVAGAAAEDGYPAEADGAE
ncbi:mechanosensitive ion channel family protein [Halorarum salinum]|uniref:Mechanosensitive ion channel family protein n=2 Tax=Halorarum salinum TaxID=2743089 RepID=A0A7D5LDJ1_9EURY|nr:mechanosensitive ion channel family protein [Halobaculum salinum]